MSSGCTHARTHTPAPAPRPFRILAFLTMSYEMENFSAALLLACAKHKFSCAPLVLDCLRFCCCLGCDFGGRCLNLTMTFATDVTMNMSYDDLYEFWGVAFCYVLLRLSPLGMWRYQ